MLLHLASASEARANLLRAAGLYITVQPARIDEETVRRSLEAEAATPRDIADTLAEMKARKVAERTRKGLVLGCDQVLELDRRVLSKPASPEMARAQLRDLRGRMHRLLSAAVLYEDGAPVWRHVGEARLIMRDLSDGYIDSYVTRSWDSIRNSVGAYRIEEEGVRLFSAVEGDHFTILGLPMIPLLSYLGTRGIIET
jgi:septum formation protein